jgi:hypothetical protein
MSKSEQLANVNINDLDALLSSFQTKCLPCPSKQILPFSLETQLRVLKTYRNEIYVVHMYCNMLVGNYIQNCILHEKNVTCNFN